MQNHWNWKKNNQNIPILEPKILKIYLMSCDQFWGPYIFWVSNLGAYMILKI